MPEEEGVSKATTSETSSLIALQYDRTDSLKQTLKNFKKDSASRKTKTYFEQRLSSIDELRTKFKKTHEVIVLSQSDKKEKYFTIPLVEVFEELFLEVYCNIKDAFDERFPTTTVNAPTSTLNLHANLAPVKLPQLPIPSFSGKFTEWPAFHDAFNRLIHSNDDLDEVQKFHFLKKALPSDVDLDIQRMSLTAANYEIAWDLCEKRYNNPRILFMHCMNSLYNLPNLSKERSVDIKSLLNTAKVCVNECNRLKVSISGSDHWLAYFLSTKLPSDTRKAWELHLGSQSTIPTFSDLEGFLNNRLIIIDVIENRSVNEGISHPSSESSTTLKKLVRKSHHSAIKTDTCPLCHESHVLRRCSKFLEKDCFVRKNLASQFKLCLNCLGKTHTTSQCTSARNCQQCGQRHHTLLHFPSSSFAHASNTPVTSCPLNTSIPSLSQTSKHLSSSSPTHTYSSNHIHQGPIVSLKSNRLTSAVSTSCGAVLLATALVTVQNEHTGQNLILRALVDQGSECTLISEHAAQALGLKRSTTSADIIGVGHNTSSQARFEVQFLIRSRIDPRFMLNINRAYILKSLTGLIPGQLIKPQAWSHLQDLTLADPHYYKPSKIDLILGADVYGHLVLPDIRTGHQDQPIAQRTHLGWVLLGQTNTTLLPSTTSSHSTTIRCHHSSVELSSIVQRYFDQDQVPLHQELTAEEQWCETFFKKTHTRQPDGRYVVRLPLKSHFDPSQTLGRSRQIALNRFHNLERKLQSKPQFREQYTQVMQEYFDLGQITPAVTTERQHAVVNIFNQPTTTSCVLPHHAVIKESSLTTKVRIVFDASCKTSNGKSLNDLLCIGPPLQNELPAVILNWRMHKYVFTADIQKMYRCINMNSEDVQYQRILWRDHNQDLREYCLTTVTFGTASAPYTAIRVIHQLADDEKVRYPLAEHILKSEIYVDDVLSGSHSVERAIELRDQVTATLQSAGMQLRKWCSNTTELLHGIGHEHLSSMDLIQFNNNISIKTLGMLWLPRLDHFIFRMELSGAKTSTKRSVLSTIARLFDPLGLITPFLVCGKLIFKSICSFRESREHQSAVGLDWDDPLPLSIQKQWELFINNLSTLGILSVPRWINYHPYEVASLQLHAFCDGSFKAYAAATYLRIKYTNETVSTHLLAAKSRVTPMKPLTIPRVELCGAVLATQLANWVHSHLRTDFHITTHYWTDAEIVLYWILGEPNRWKTYVANRVGAILQASSRDQWNHVSTLDNPADCATRGMTVAQLSKFELWWKGPPWLTQSEDEWPKFNPSKIFKDADVEESPKKVQINVARCTDSIIYRYSSFGRLQRIVAYLLRFLTNARTIISERQRGPITVRELNHSCLLIIKLVQHEEFPAEINAISKNKPVPASSKLSSLTPWIDKDILRIRGRLSQTSLPFRQKHPIILPRAHFITQLLIKQAHYTTLHGGVQLTLTYLRQQYWILSGRRAVRQQLQECIKCFRNKPQASNQLMGDLPFHRVNPPSKPFLATGIDYAGPIELKASKFRGHTIYKGYIAIFICLATKSIHLEAVTGLTTEHFYWALQRFLGRRGICKDLYSDCGTNFVGAWKVLQTNQRKFALEVEKEILPKLAAQSIQWHFNPPHSPNFGGLWEVNVKSIKHHLRRTVDTKLTYEELSTVLTRIEACLNSRPLCPLTCDPEDLSVLTPAHFLTGESLLATPDDYENTTSLCHHYAQMQRMLHSFWSRWTSDWLSHLQSRPKWRTEAPNLALNDLVIVKDERFPPKEWNIGRITDLHRGADDLVRVVTVKTRQGTYKRSISKICRLPIPNSS